MKKCMVVLCVLFLGGCMIESTPDRTPRVFIRGNGKVETTYEFDGDGNVSRSSTTNRFGVPVTRQYSYDGGNELESVVRETPSTRETVYFGKPDTDRNAGDRTLGSTRTVVDSRGLSTGLSIRYLYTDDGKLKEIVVTDANGNVQSKSATEERKK